MAQRIKATAGTGAVAAPNQIAFTLPPKLFDGGKRPVVSVTGLTGVETADFWYHNGVAWEEVDNGSGSQLQFTATYNSDVFNAPGQYGITKSSTAGSVSVRVNDPR